VGWVAEWGEAGGGGWAKLDCALEVVMRVLVFKLIAVEVRDARSSWKHLRGFVRFFGRKRPFIIEVRMAKFPRCSSALSSNSWQAASPFASQV